MTVGNNQIMPWRIMNMWQQIDGDAIACEGPSLLISAEMLNTEPSSILGQFVDKIASLGFNGLDLRDHPEEHTAAIASFGKYLAERGIKMFLGHSWTEFENGGLTWVPVERTNTNRTSIKLCPFNEQLRNYWRKLVAKESVAFPGFGGYKFINSENHYANGTPWMCDCPKCQAISRQERFLVAVEFLAGLLDERDASLLWNNHQDDPWGQYREIEVFAGLTDRLPKNVQVVFSETYWDQEPGWPRNPFFEALEPPDSGRAPYLIRFQLPGQYRGMAQFPCCMVDAWAKIFNESRRLKLSGFWVQGFLARPEPDHLLNMVNWYALGRYASDPEATADQIMIQWASMTYGTEASPTVVELLRLTYEASVKVFMFEGLMASHFSALASLAYLDSHLCGPYRKSKRIKDHIGLEFPLDMYSPERAAKIKADPTTRLLFGRQLITPELKGRAIAEKDDAIQLMDKMISLWKSVKEKVAPTLHKPLLKILKANRVDVMVFRAALDLYFDYKLGSLTEGKIDEVLLSFEGLKGHVVPDPVGPPPTTRRSWEEEITRNLQSFAEELRGEMRQPWLEESLTTTLLRPGVGYWQDQ